MADPTRRAVVAAAVSLPALALPRFDVSGVRVDGAEDASPAIQAALDAAGRSGGVVRLPAGRLRIGTPLRGPAGGPVTVIGEGSATTLLHVQDEPLLAFDRPCDQFRMFDLNVASVEAEKSPDTPCVAFDDGLTNSSFRNVYLDGRATPFGAGIRTRRLADTVGFTDCVIWACRGVGLEVAAGAEVRFVGGRIIGANDQREGGIGVLYAGGNGGVHLVSTDVIAWHTAVQVGKPGGPSNREVFLTHATLDSSVYGLRQWDAAYVSIAGVWAASSDEAQIRLEESAKGALLTMTGGTIFNGGAYGRPGARHGLVALNGSFVLNGVNVRHNQGVGILVGLAARDYVVSGCRIHHNGVAAEFRGEGYAVTGNVVHDNRAPWRDLGRGPKTVSANVVR